MSKEALLAMDPNILLSMVNMKLRDYFDSLEAYCDDAGISVDELNNKLMETGRVYDRSSNQYK